MRRFASLGVALALAVGTLVPIAHAQTSGKTLVLGFRPEEASLTSPEEDDALRGTVYVTLQRMEEKGYVASRLEDAPLEAGGLPRRVYRPTALGRRVLAVWTTAARLMPEFAP